MNIFSNNKSVTQPKSEKCPCCKKEIVPSYSKEYGWNFVCDDCEVNWKA